MSKWTRKCEEKCDLKLVKKLSLGEKKSIKLDDTNEKMVNHKALKDKKTKKKNKTRQNAEKKTYLIIGV